ncbi:MAG: stage V sporulation protein AB [Lachnospiraceae bacterium]|nr:stage V sporulation protein AB [Lachnospiraceae bacterium]
MNYLLLAAIGMAGGIIISAGVFALITSTKLMSRLAGKTHTGKYVRVYEDFVILGGCIFNFLYVYKVNLRSIFSSGIFERYVGVAAIGTFAFFFGIFTGCLAVALAEVLNATAIFSRRVKLRKGMSFIILFVALGKVAGILLQFFSI